MAIDKLIIKGANENNLKNINVEIPRDKLVVFTGLSGSGKSSLAFDTIYAEGQRRYVESLSSYARQFLGQMEKPNVDSIEGLSPAISIDQKTTSKNPRSTVGTVTEIYDYLRLLYARVGIPHCPVCGKEISQQTTDQIVDVVMKLETGTKIQILAPVVKNRKGEHAKELENLRKSGYSRVRIDGNIYDLSEEIKLEKNNKHFIEVIVDRLVIKDDIISRLTDSIETAVALSGGLVAVDVIGGEELEFSQTYACDEHGISIPELTPTMFSFNNPMGACPVCMGIGSYKKIDPRLIIHDENLSLLEGCIKAMGWGVNSWLNPDAGSITQMYYKGIAKHYGFDINTPWKDIPEEGKKAVLYGSEGNVRTFSSDNPTESCPDVCGRRPSTAPRCIVQTVDPIALSSRLGESTTIFDNVGLIPECITEYIGGDVVTNLPEGSPAVYITLGLFTIVQLVRNVQVLVPVYDYCIPEKQCDCSVA
ncbi:MAG: hypothetical protein IKY45_04370, partial [Clostridia bacterium]|nr:hypothetical protein [Clostridia bacterium]